MRASTVSIGAADVLCFSLAGGGGVSVGAGSGSSERGGKRSGFTDAAIMTTALLKSVRQSGSRSSRCSPRTIIRKR